MTKAAVQGTTKDRLLHEARELFQSGGFESFSLQELADAVRIKKGSLQQHFESKEAMQLAVIDSYFEMFSRWTTTIRVFEPRDQLKALLEANHASLTSGQLCPQAAMSADLKNAGSTVKSKMKKYCRMQREWLTQLIREGQKKKQFRTDISSGDLADLTFAISLGGQLISSSAGDPARFMNLKKRLFQLIEPNGFT